MWDRIVITAMAVIVLGGCRSPQPIMHSLQSSDLSFVQMPEATESAVRTSESGSIEEYVQLGLSRNPQIAAAQHKIEATKHRIPQVISLPDPIVNTTTHLSPVETAAGPQAFSLAVSQKLTNAERRATKAAIVSDEVAAAEFDLIQIQLEIAERIRTSCYQLLFIRKSIEITKEDAESLAQIAEVIERQYEVKQSVTQQDVLNVQVEQSKVENQLTELGQKEKSFQARLTRLLHVSPRSKLLIVDQLKSQTRQLNLDELIASAVQARPDLQSQLANINRDGKKIHLAQLEKKPDFTVGLNWIGTSNSGISPVANGDDALLLGIGFNLPVYKSRIRAGIHEAQANHRASQSKLISLQDIAGEEVFDLVAKLESNQQTLELIRNDIIPKAQRTLDLAIDEYSTDEIEYVQLIANWRSVLRYRVTEASLQSQYSQLLASLARSVGRLEPINTFTMEGLNQPEFEDMAEPVKTPDDEPKSDSQDIAVDEDNESGADSAQGTDDEEN